MNKLAASCLSGAMVFLVAGAGRAATLSVGPGKTYAKIADAWAMAKPGDVIEVQGGQTYPGPLLFGSDRGGTASQPITVRGILVNGQRPLLKGIGTGYDNMVVLLNSNHFVMESFEVVGNDNDTDYCLVHKADDVTVRDMVVHDCLHQAGLVSTDTESGTITVEYSNFYHNGNGEYSHQLYMASDQAMYPHATFRLRYSYVHDGVGGNNVVSRAERNEVYYNWIEGAYYHELDLIGPDVGGTSRPCDSDVVGNVLVKTSSWRIARIGGDGSGDSMGHFRFANNTMVLADATTAALGLQYTVQSVEMYNNVIIGPSAAAKVYTVDDQTGPTAAFSGSNNWVVSSITGVPMPWTMTVTGADPGFVNPAMHDLRPTSSSPLVGAGTMMTSAGTVASPLLLPAFNPPQRRLIPLGTAEARSFSKAPSIGAFEPTAAPPGTPPPGVGGPPNTMTGGGGGGGASRGGCGCRTSAAGASWGWIVGFGAAVLAVCRRRARQSAAPITRRCKRK